MNIDKSFTFVKELVNKDQNGFINAAQYNLFAERAQVEEYMQLYGNPHEYQPGHPVPRIAYGMTQKIHDDLRPFIKLGTINVDKFGKGKYPSDYVHVSAIRYTVHKDGGGSKEVSLEIIPDAKLGDRLSSSIVNPTKSDPICSMYDDHIQFYPKNLAVVKFSYLRQPKVPKWAFTIVNGREVYDPDNSVDFEFPDEVHNGIIIKILSYLGITLREPELMQYAETKNAQGI